MCIRDRIRLDEKNVEIINAHLMKQWGCGNLKEDIRNWDSSRFGELLAGTQSFLRKLVAFCRKVTDSKLSKQIAEVGLTDTSKTIWIRLIENPDFDEAFNRAKPIELRNLEKELFGIASQALGEYLCKVILRKKKITGHEVEFSTKIGGREKLKDWIKEIVSYPPSDPS